MTAITGEEAPEKRLGTVVIALGGNAILQRGQRGTTEEQLENIRGTAASIVTIIELGYRVVLTHGNGPQVGNILLQQEEARTIVPPSPLDVCGAQTQGQLGYLIQQSLDNELSHRGLRMPVVTVLTQVLVEAHDPAFRNPTKPIGPFYTEAKARRLIAQKGWAMREDSGRGWRRLVPSPKPLAIWEASIIRKLVEAGAVVISTAGGGIPVVRQADGRLQGVEAVIDKDLAAQILAHEVGADSLLILTDVQQVSLNYRLPDEVKLGRITVSQAKQYQKEGHFKAGSMGPKVEAAVRALEAGARCVIITALDQAVDALAGHTGTRVVPDDDA